MIVPQKVLYDRIARIEIEKAQLWWWLFVCWCWLSCFIVHFSQDPFFIIAACVSYAFSVVSLVHLTDVRNVYK